MDIYNINLGSIIIMKNIPSFKEFKKYDSLLESVTPDLIEDFQELEKADPYYTVNEGALMDTIKNSMSKFFLGPLSRTGMIDETRKIMTDLEIDLIEQKWNLEDQIDSIHDQIGVLSRSQDRDKILALTKDRDSKIKELETYIKSQKLKIKKCLDHISKLVASSPRRKEYYEAGRAEDEIAIAEVEYQLAKRKSDSSELKKYEEKVRMAKQEAAEKVEDLKSDIEATSEVSAEIPVERVDAAKEKKKVSSRKGSDIIKRKNELEKEIADLRSEMEKKLRSLEKKIGSAGKAPVAYVDKVKIQLLELSSALDSKINLLNALRSLGDSEKEIALRVSKESAFSKLADMINLGIMDGNDANTGTKKTISSIFSKNSKDGTGEVRIEKLKDAIKKIK
jgi:hypothetical protein